MHFDLKLIIKPIMEAIREEVIYYVNFYSIGTDHRSVHFLADIHFASL